MCSKNMGLQNLICKPMFLSRRNFDFYPTFYPTKTLPPLKELLTKVGNTVAPAARFSLKIVKRGHG